MRSSRSFHVALAFAHLALAITLWAMTTYGPRATPPALRIVGAWPRIRYPAAIPPFPADDESDRCDAWVPTPGMRWTQEFVARIVVRDRRGPPTMLISDAEETTTVDRVRYTIVLSNGTEID